MQRNVLITGATGMIGGLVLEHCLAEPTIKQVTSLVRRSSGISHDTLQEIIVPNFMDLSAFQGVLSKIDLVFYCLGTYTGSVSADDMRRTTVDMPAHLAKLLEQAGARPRFCLLSGAGADRREKSRAAFARDKGAIENILTKADFSSFHTFRPSYIYPVTPRQEPNLS